MMGEGGQDEAPPMGTTDIDSTRGYPEHVWVSNPCVNVPQMYLYDIRMKGTYE
jgi:hypothetical protein